MQRGVSGGERKRVAIGVELLTDPSVSEAAAAARQKLQQAADTASSRTCAALNNHHNIRPEDKSFSHIQPKQEMCNPQI